MAFARWVDIHAVFVSCCLRTFLFVSCAVLAVLFQGVLPRRLDFHRGREGERDGGRMAELRPCVYYVYVCENERERSEVFGL